MLVISAPLKKLWRPLIYFRPRSLSSRLHSTPVIHARTRRSSVLNVPPTSQIGIPHINLRKYQEECIQAVLSHLANGHRRLGISLATGSGKTVIFTHLIDRVPSIEEDATQTLILAHRRELVEQAARHCSAANPTKTVEVEMGNNHASGSADITVASVQSITSGERICKYDPRRFKLVMVDEAHHIVAPQYLSILEHFGLSYGHQQAKMALIGVSATFSRLDGLSLGSVIDHIVYHKDYVDLMNEDWLADAVFTTVQTKTDLSTVKTSSAGDFQTPSLSKAVNTPETNAITVRSWLKKAEGRKSTLVFCVDVAHVIALASTFIQHGIKAKYITSNTHPRARSETLDAFRRGDFPVLLNCGIFTEGTDIPNIDCIILARPTKSRNLLVQMIGRGTRKYPGKENCHIVDFVSSLETGVVTTPTLFGLDPTLIVEKADVKKLEQLRDGRDREQELKEQASAMSVAAGTKLKGSVTFTDYKSITDLIDDTSLDRYIRAISSYTWVRVGENKHILSCRNQGHLTIEKANDDFVVKYTQQIPGKIGGPMARPRELSRSVTFDHAVNAADTFAKDTFPAIYILQSAPWRKKPASESQVEFLNTSRDNDKKLGSDTLTMGKASDMITKIKHGVRGRFRKSQAGLQKTRKTEEKRRRLRDREAVRVGPLRRNDRSVVGTPETVSAAVNTNPQSHGDGFLARDRGFEQSMKQLRHKSDTSTASGWAIP
ncbi:P-loop containing nucleoside triphosphate hydrolase protein [Viridothelium virens]|uniref:P-loop containing nucleoside triphosphate hydrolase protein n=1 Tax=Viridothelium virens TaxID=1048519 RepID=A0A6A6H4G3_VIRVR|nr:P-loop containing nucleoside triphosphate hydrolase protein [Viridothelium virens]